MIHEAVKYENDYWHQQNLPSTGCFGYVNHHLILGTAHHQAIMMALINNGWTWEQLMAAPQAWGWYEITSDHYHSKIKTAPPDLKQGEYPYYITIWFSSDAGYQNKDEIKRAMGAFAQLYHLPCFDSNEGVVKAVNPNKEYGSGLHGKEWSENWTDEKIKNIQDHHNNWLFQIPEDMPKPDVPDSEPVPPEPIEEQKSESAPSSNNHFKVGDIFSFNNYSSAATYEVLAVDDDQVTFTGAPDTKYKTDIGKQWTYHLDNLSDTTIDQSKTDPVKKSGVWLVHYKAPQGYEGEPPFDKALGKMTVTAPDGPGASQVVIDYFQKNFGVPVDITGSDPYWPGQTSVKNSSITKESEQSYPRGWSGIMEKAQAIRQAGGVRILRNDPDHVVGTVQSGSDPANKGPYNTEIWRDDPNSQAITMWNCDCPWSDYSWGRTRQWKKYEGRPCAHTLALFWDAQSNPPQGTTTAPESQPPTPAPGGQMMMNQGLIQPLGQPPMQNVPLTGEGMPPPISPTPQQQPAISQPTVPGKEQGTISFPGALSKVAADDFFRGTNRDSEVLEAFVYYNGQIAFAKGFHKFAWEQLNIPHDYDESKLAAGSIELIYTRPYTEASDPEGYVVVDFESQDITHDSIPLSLQLAVLKKVQQYYPTATIFQGKYANWTESAWKEAAFNNGDIVRTWDTVQGMAQQAYGQPGYPVTIGKNKSGEVLYSDDQTTVVIFPLKTGPLGHHLVKVECPTQNLYLDNTNAQPFVKKHT